MHAIVMHAKCGGPAFKYDHMPKAGEKIDPRYITTMGGDWPPEGATGMRCGNCHNRLSAVELAPGPMVYDMADEDDMAVIYGEYIHEGENDEDHHRQ